MRIIPLTVAVVLAGLPACTCGEAGPLDTAVPVIAVATQTLVFEDTYVGDSTEQPLTIRNSGNDTLKDVQARITGSAPYSISAAPPALIEPGQEVVMRIAFRPQSPGEAIDTLTITSDAENAPSLEVRLTGTGIPQPPCDDDNDCTLDSFNLATGACDNVFRQGSCDDGNACTQEDQCVDGACKGTGVTCSDDVSCTTDTCDPATGCLFVPDNSACEDDENPCTIESCDPELGCTRQDAVNGTACGPIVQCQPIRVCVDAICQPFAIPDGTQCFDGNPCTINDTCRMGACVGDGVTQDPSVVSRVPLFGAPYTQAILRDDGSIGLWDWAWPRTFGSGAIKRGVVTILDPLMQVQARADIDANGTFVPAVGGFALLQSSVDCGCDTMTCTGCVKTFAVENGTATARATLEMESAGVYRPVGVGTRAAWCSTSGDLAIAELSDLDAPSVHEHPVDQCLQVTLRNDGAYAVVRARRPLGNDSLGVYALTATDATPTFPPSTTLAALGLVALGTDKFVGLRDGSTVAIHDLMTGASLGEHTVDGNGVLGLAMDGNRVVVVRRVGENYGLLMTLLDVSNPAAVVTLDETSVDNGGCVNCVREVGFNGELVLFGGGTKAQLFALNGTAFEVRTAPGHGGGSVVAARPQGVYIMGRDAIHRASVMQDGTAVLSAGRALHGETADAWALPDVPEPSIIMTTVHEDDPRTFQLSSSPFHVRSAEEPHHVVGAVSVAPPAVQHTSRYTQARMVDNSLYGLEYITVCDDPECTTAHEQVAFFRADINVSSMDPTEAAYRVPIPLASDFRGFYGIAISADRSEAAVSLSRDVESEGVTVVALLRGVASTPTVVGHADVEPLVRSVAVENGRVWGIASEHPLDTIQTAFRGAHFLAFEPDGMGGLTQLGSLPLPGSNHILLAAPPIALVSMEDGLAFIGVDTPVPTLAFHLPLHEPPVTASIRQDTLYLGQNASMTVAFPPCALP